MHGDTVLDTPAGNMVSLEATHSEVMMLVKLKMLILSLPMQCVTDSILSNPYSSRQINHLIELNFFMSSRHN